MHTQGEHREYPNDVALQESWAVNGACNMLVHLCGADNGQVDNTRGAGQRSTDGQGNSRERRGYQPGTPKGPSADAGFTDAQLTRDRIFLKPATPAIPCESPTVPILGLFITAEKGWSSEC